MKYNIFVKKRQSHQLAKYSIHPLIPRIGSPTMTEAAGLEKTFDFII